MVCPKGHKVNAKEWLQSVLDLAGGKGGGGPAKAQGTAGSCEKIFQMVEEAKKFVEECNLKE